MRIGTGRNVSGDMRKIIEVELENRGSSFVPAMVALDIVEQLRTDDPELLNKWLDQHAVQIVRAAIVDIERGRRMAAKMESIAARKLGPTSAFSSAVARYEDTGNPETLNPWLKTTYVVSTGNSRKPLAEMDQDDLIFASEQFRKLAQSNSLQAAFLRVLAGSVGALTVGEVYGEEDLAAAWRRLST